MKMQSMNWLWFDGDGLEMHTFPLKGFNVAKVNPPHSNLNTCLSHDMNWIFIMHNLQTKMPTKAKQNHHTKFLKNVEMSKTISFNLFKIRPTKMKVLRNKLGVNELFFEWSVEQELELGRVERSSP